MTAEASELPRFQRLFVPLISDAKKRLRRRVDASLYNLLTDRAHGGWEGYLLKRLCLAGKQVLAQQFEAFYSIRSVFAKKRGDQQSNKDSAYREFEGSDLAVRMRKILTEFPELARLCETLVANWVSSVSEFLERLESDRSELPHHFSGKSFACPIDEVHVGLSDPHCGGRCVMRINFPGSESLIYKPRSLAPEALFTVLLEQLNEKSPPHDFRSARCWDREDYGWMEDVVRHPCREPADLHAFYWRAGALLALIYLLRGVDMHRENLMADGAHPILVDLETLWHPQEHIGAADHPTAHTVLRTGFLPQNDPAVGAAYEWNALSHRASSALRTSRHLPMLTGKEHPAPGFLPDILAGFRWIGEQVFEERQLEGEFQLWVKALVRCRRRRILRSTSWYGSVIERLIAPPSLRTAESFAAECSSVGQGIPPLTEDERSSLLQMDVPYIAQAAGRKWEQKITLPVQNTDAFLEQETFIINALAPAANGNSL